MPGDLPPETIASPIMSLSRFPPFSTKEYFPWTYPGDARRLDLCLTWRDFDDLIAALGEGRVEAFGVRGLRAMYSETSLSLLPTATTREPSVSIHANISSL